jgi:hypothetical protein
MEDNLISDNASKEDAIDVAEESTASAVSEAAEGDGQGQTAQETVTPPAAGSDEWFAADSQAFGTAFPYVDKEALFGDEDFVNYAEGKVGSLPLADIYRGYLRLKKNAMTAARTQAARANATGSLRQTAAEAEAEYYTLAEMQQMSAKYIEDHWDKVQKSLKRLK